MKMKVICILSILLLFFSCKKNEEKLSEKLLQNSNGEDYISLVCDELEKETFDLTIDDIKLANSLLIQAFVKLNSDLKKENQNFICDSEDEILIDKYTIQYCGHFNKNKEKVISIQCIRKDNKDDDAWKTKWIRAIGGGCRYVHGQINLNRKSHSNFFINAPK